MSRPRTGSNAGQGGASFGSLVLGAQAGRGAAATDRRLARVSDITRRSVKPAAPGEINITEDRAPPADAQMTKPIAKATAKARANS